MFKPLHCGLYFTPDHVAQARRDRDHEPFRSALLYLRDREQRGAEAAAWNGLRYRFEADELAGAQAIADLEDCIADPLTEDMTYLDTIGQALALAQAFEMTRDHPGWRSLKTASTLSASAPTTIRRSKISGWRRSSWFPASCWSAKTFSTSASKS